MNDKHLEKLWEVSDEEKRLIKAFMDNTAMRDAVKKTLLKAISSQVNIKNPMQHWVSGIDRSMPDESYAKLVKMIAQAQQELYDGFLELESLADSVTVNEGGAVEEYK